MDVMTALHNYRGLSPKLDKFGKLHYLPGIKEQTETTLTFQEIWVIHDIFDIFLLISKKYI